MQLRPGTRVGQYEIDTLLGEGGMGEVYRGRDLTLHRDVAVKVIGRGALDDPSALARFEREAQLLASLNHPHIASIFGVVDTGGMRAIVMELVEGQSLADRLSIGALPVRDTLAIADQIAAAVEAAHEKGIVHRDLKPANITFTAGGAVKILDFGIAKAAAPLAALDSTVEATRAGTILGTAAYMSPEQARGLAVDARTDVWAFGAILYEMLAGRRAFDGATGSDVVAAVLTRDPDWTALPADVPASILRLLRRCLERDPARRLRQIGAARYAIEELSAASPGAAGSRRSSRVLAIAAVLMLAGFILQVVMLVRNAHRPEEQPAILSMNEPGGESLYLFAAPIALSPDGTRVAFVTNSADGRPHVWLRPLAATTAELLHGAYGGVAPFWSPDGRALGFFADGHVRVLDLGSGAVRTVAPWTGSIAGGTWSASGSIIFADVTGLKRVAADGEVTSVAAPAAPDQGGTFLAAPCFLPDGRHYLYFAGSARFGEGAVMAGSVDGGAPTRVLATPSMAVYAAPGYLIYQREGQIVAQRFNGETLAIVGEPEVLAAGAWAWSVGGMAALSASESGMLMFATRRTVTTQLTWFDRNGRPDATLGEPGEWLHVELSPDERSVAAERMDPRTGAGAIWTFDVARNVAQRLTPEPTWSLAPTWSPDSSRVLYAASRDGVSNLFTRSAEGGHDEIRFRISADLKIPTAWTRDGRIIYTSGAAAADILSLPETGAGAPAPVVRTAANEGSGKVSPDGRWLAYTSNESGTQQVYVSALSGSGRWPISRTGGSQPRWQRDGKALYFVAPDSTLMTVPVMTGSGAGFAAGQPEALPIRLQADVTGWRYAYDVTADGRRVIANMPAGRDVTPAIVAIPHWTGLLRK